MRLSFGQSSLRVFFVGVIRLLVLGLVLGLYAGCQMGFEPPSHHEAHQHDNDLGVLRQAVVSCTERKDTGYVSGKAFSITVITVDGKPVEKATGSAYWVMQQAAAKSGVQIRIVSGFRTMAEQQYLYNCYLTKRCNGGNLAARPGYSNHQSGHALDLNTSVSSVYNWLSANGGRYGFKRTVPSEKWHWEWWGGGPGGSPCQKTCTPRCLDGGTYLDKNCQKVMCSAVGAKCTTQGVGGPRCVSVFCPGAGKANVCIKDDLGMCNNGVLSIQKCSAFGHRCVADAKVGARCISVFCPATGTKNVCLKDDLGVCNNGKLTVTQCSAVGYRCIADAKVGARCISIFCPATGRKEGCYKQDLAICDNGKLTINKCPAANPCVESPKAHCKDDSPVDAEKKTEPVPPEPGRADAGTGEPPDSAVGSEPKVADSDVASDAGVVTDNGATPDAGATTDMGAVDSTAKSDQGQSSPPQKKDDGIDVVRLEDKKAPSNPGAPSGCACQTGTSELNAPPALLLLFFLLPLFHSRRRKA